MDKGAQQLWEKALSRIQTKVDTQIFNLWFKPLKLNLHSDSVDLIAPNTFFRDWLADRYLGLIQSELNALTTKNYRINLLANEDKASPTRDNITAKNHVTRSPVAKAPSSPRTLNPKYTFDHFVVGTSNQLAHAACYAVSNMPAKVYNPLFIYGGVGLGKTHLLNAIGQEALAQQPYLRICYISSETFMNDLINSIRFEKMESFRRRYRSQADVLLLDDIQFIAGKDRTQEEFFHTFNALHESGRQIVITSDKLPKEIPGLEERLRSRFEWGMIADIQAPDLETRLAILKKKADSADIPLPDDVALYLGNHIKSNIRELEGSLIRLAAHSSVSRNEITLDFVKEIFHDTISIPQDILSVEQIQKAVASFYDVKISDLKSPRKMRSIARPRQIAMYMCRKLTSFSFPDIGLRFGGKDHSTVIHAVNKISKLIGADPSLLAELNSLEKQIRNFC